MAGVLFHIGYHKAASTVLQDQLFFAPDAGFLAPMNEPRHKLVERFVLPHPMTFDPDLTRHHYLPLLAEGQRRGSTVVLSHERFSGYPPSGGFDSSIIAKRLQRTFPEARVLVVVREQLASIYSMYLQYVTDGGGLPLKDYLTPPRRYFKRMPSFSEDFYRYDRLIRLYRQLFGEDRVMCLPYELLLADPKAFQARIFDFGGQPRRYIELRNQNRGRSPSFQVVQRFVNRHFGYSELGRGRHHADEALPRRFGAVSRFWRPGMTGWLDRPLERRMRSLLRDRFDGAFAGSNVKLARMMDCDIGQYGYQLPADAAILPRHDRGRSVAAAG